MGPEEVSKIIMYASGAKRIRIKHLLLYRFDVVIKLSNLVKS